MQTCCQHPSNRAVLLVCWSGTSPTCATYAHTLTPELGIDPGHIVQKSLTVLNPLGKVDTHIMDDADMAGPLVFCFAFAFVLLLVRTLHHLPQR